MRQNRHTFLSLFGILVLSLLPFFSLASTSCTISNDLREQDSLALVSLYNSLGGDNWENIWVDTVWDLNRPMDEWWGVQLNPSGRVNQLILHSSNLIGPLPDELGNLTALTYLRIGGVLWGEIPSTLANLTELETLLLAGGLSGNVPDFIGDLTKLVSLSFNKNRLTGTIPETLCNLESLAILSLTGNYLTGTLPDCMKDLEDLVFLFLSYNDFDSSLLSNIHEYEQLLILHASSHTINGPFPAGIEQLAELDEIGLAECGITGQLPAYLGERGYRELYLSNNQFEGCYPPEFEGLCRPDVTVEFYNNPGLPDYGNSFHLFCSSGIGNCANPNFIFGTVAQDENEDCVYDDGSLGLRNWMIELEGDASYYAISDSLGNYVMQVPNGNFELTAKSPNAYWESCIIDSLVSFSNGADSLQINVPATAIYECGFMKVDIGTPILRYCDENQYYVQYCNEGTSPEHDVYIEVILDEHLSYLDASIPLTSSDGQLYRFDVGDVAVNECKLFNLYTLLECDSAYIGQAHCVEAHVYPDSTCLPPNIMWDGSSLEVEGSCNGDSIQFKLINVGDPMTNSSVFIVTEDELMLRIDSVQLGAAETMNVKFLDEGGIYRLEAEQAENHPDNGIPSATVAGCIVDSLMEFEFINQFILNDFSPFVDIDCQQSKYFATLNRVDAQPSGVGPTKDIYALNPIDYQIGFQNTSSSTAGCVEIRDTLSAHLDLTTLSIIMSSHPYTFSIEEQTTLVFRFDEIELPDSTTNELASQGFIKFQITPKSDTPLNTQITNQASIYFDDNDPIVTPEIFHTYRDRPYIQQETTTYLCENDSTNVEDFSNIEHILFNSYQLELTNHFMVLPTVYTEIDSLIANGNEPYTQEFIYTDMNGCDSVVIVNFMPTVATTNSISSSFKLFPNPTQSGITIQLEEEITSLQVHLYDAKGVFMGEVATSKIHAQEYYCDLTHVSQGMYFMKLNLNGLVVYQKIISN